MLFIGNLLTDYYHSFIHSYSPFLTRPVLKIFERDFTHHPFIGRPFSPFVWLSYGLERTHFSPFWPFLFVPGERTLCYSYFYLCSLCRTPQSGTYTLIESAWIFSAKVFPEMYASARPGPRVKRKISSPAGSIFHFSLADPISYLIWLKRSGR